VEDTADVIPINPAPEGVEVRHLRAFVAVAEELNFSRAAERLYVSQPALSRQIRALERAVGCDLLRRSTHRVELTLAGEALLDRAHVVLVSSTSSGRFSPRHRRRLPGPDNSSTTRLPMGRRCRARMSEDWRRNQ
jgi:DNA-binding transcriptional LysR family regulator